MENIEDLAESKEYKNYNSVNTALSLIGQCLEPYTVQKLESVHQKIKHKLGVLPPCIKQCSKNHHHSRWCQTCSAWKKELESFLKNPGCKLNWWKMKSWNWPVNAVNITEVFLPLKWNAVDIHLDDLSTAVNIWDNCTEFPVSIVNAIKPVRNLRNDIHHKHAAKQRITDGDKTNMFITIFGTLNDPDVQAALIPHCNQLVVALQDLDKHGITTKEVNEAADRIEKVIREQNTRHEKKILAAVKKQINDKFDTCIAKFSRYMKCILVLVIPVISAIAIYSLRGHVNNYTTVQTDSYKYANDDCLSEDPHTSFQEQAINMHGYISKHSTLIGRQWFFERLRRHLKAIGLTHGVLVIAEMGYGKSALAANIICASSTDASYSFRQNLVAYYICRFDSVITKKKHIFIRRLASMFSRNIPEFSEVLKIKDKLCLEFYNPSHCEEDPGGCIYHCLISPLERLQVQNKSSYFVVLDALDECKHRDNDGGIAFLLQSNLHLFPKWIKLIVTCRNVSYCTQLQAHLYTMELNSNDEENQNDLKTYYSLQEYKQYETGASNFLLASFSFDVSKGQLPSFDIFFEQQFARFFRDKYMEHRTVLEIICASFEAMTEEELGDILSNSAYIAPEVYESSLQLLYDFIQKIDGKLHLWHVSLKEWLLNTNLHFRIKVSKGHHYIATYLLKQLQTNPKKVDIVQLVTHASLAKPFSEESLQLFDKVNITDLQPGLIKNDYPVHRLARQFDNFVAMQHLIKHFPNLEVLDNFNVTPVFVAASRGNVETLKALVEANARTNFRTQSYTNVMNLESAVRIALETHHWNYGILDIAAQNGHLETVRYIVENLNYSFNKRNGITLLPIHLSCKYGHTAIIKYMYNKHNWMLDSLCLYFASEKGHIDLVTYLLNTGIEDKCKQCESKLHFIPRGKSRVQGTAIDTIYDEEYREKYVLYDDWNQIACETALHAAVRFNHVEIVKLLIKNNISKGAVLCFDRAGRTPLISALQYNRTEITKIFLEYKLVKTNMNCASPKPILDFTQLNYMERKELDSYFRCDGCTVMYAVAYFDRMWFVKLLSEENVTTIWNKTDNMGCYPAHTAACVGSTQIIKHLLNLDKDEIHEQKCRNGSTPIEIAASCSSFISFSILFKSRVYTEKYLNKQIFKHSVIFNALNRSMEGLSLIDSKIVQNNVLQIIDAVLSPEWDLNIKNTFHQNILHIAVMNGHFAVLNKLFSDYPEKSKQLMTEKDSNYRTPLDFAITALDDKESTIISSGNVPLEQFMTSVEHTIFISLDFVEKNNLNSNMRMKSIILDLIRKNYISVVFEYLQTHKRFYGDNDFVYEVLVQDKTSFASSVVLMQWFTYRLNSTKDSLMCLNNCQATLTYCHLHTIARKHMEIVALLKQFTNVDSMREIEGIVMMDFKLNVHFPDMLSKCYDKEGFNVLDRAIQGSSHGLVKYLLDIGVRSNKHVTDLIRLAIIPSDPAPEDDALVFTQQVSDNQMLFKVIRKSSYMEVLRRAVNSNYTEFQNLVIDLYINCNIYYRNETRAYEHIDMVVSTLIANFHNSLQSHSFCSKKGNTFSLVHIAAMHGLTLTLSNISEYFGKDVLNCSNHHYITPLYLAKALNQIAAVNILYHVNLLSSYENVDLMSFYLQFYLTFLKRIYGEKHMLCIFDYYNVRPKNMYKILKGSICIRRTAKALKDRFAVEQSSSLMNLYTLFQLKHICSSKCKEIARKRAEYSQLSNALFMLEKEHSFKSFAKKMDYYMIKFTRDSIQVLEYILTDGGRINHIDMAINELENQISHLSDHPSDYSYCYKYWFHARKELFERRLSSDVLPHQFVNERYTFGLLRTSFRRLVLLLKVDILKEISFIAKGAGYLLEDVSQVSSKMRSFLPYFRNFPSYNYLSELKHLPFFNNAYQFRLKLIRIDERFELFDELLKAKLSDKWISQADRIRKEYTEFRDGI